jgi:hypothetical protein
VLLVDLICHGVPSLRAFQQYRDQMFPDGLDQYYFRAKTDSWNFSNIEAKTKTGRRYSIRVTRDVFQQAFQMHHLILMKCCHDCRFQGGTRSGDITLGDFWGVPDKWNDKRGVSVVLASSDTGRKCIAALAASNSLHIEPSDFATAAKGNSRLLSGLRPIPHLRAVFMGAMVRGVPFTTLARVFLPPLRASLVFTLPRTPAGRILLLDKAKALPIRRAIRKLGIIR